MGFWSLSFRSSERNTENNHIRYMQVEELAEPDEEPTPLTSASQITDFEACERKWALRTIAKIRTPQTPSQVLGDEVDGGQLQLYLRDGRPFDFTKRASAEIAASALPFLPQPKSPGLEVQKRFVLPSASSKAGKPAPFAYLGFIDLWLPERGLEIERATIWPARFVSPLTTTLDANGRLIPIVDDFKTSKNVKRYAKGPDVLAHDVQAMIYATWAMWSTGARAVDLVWTYMQTEGHHKCTPTYLRVDADHVVREFLKIDATAQRLMKRRAELAGVADKEAAALSLPPNPNACGDFGGCPHRHRCFPSLGPLESIDAITAIAAQKKGLPIMSDKPSLLERMRAKKAAAGGAAPSPTQDEALVFPPPEETPAEPPAAAVATGINPPEKDLPPAPPVGTPAPKEDKPKATRAKASKDAPAGDEGEEITVTWAEERFSPVQYNSFGVGPFTYTTRVRPGETFDDAFRRAHAKLAAAATIATADKAETFKRTLGRAS
jgi:hypothetical protein